MSIGTPRRPGRASRGKLGLECLLGWSAGARHCARPGGCFAVAAGVIRQSSALHAVSSLAPITHHPSPADHHHQRLHLAKAPPSF